ncbi:hypothetical protein [Actinoallomurus sp. CA-142502]|uniref:hypothetical protein n=1 Tax=Actinoallomurus sp. CA-142502 TaxID=3239885 RepID=UPI003D9081EB
MVSRSAADPPTRDLEAMARSHSRRSAHRRKRQSRRTAGLGIAGGVLGVGAVAGLIVGVRAHGDHGMPAPRTVAARTSAGPGSGVSSLSRLKTGSRLDVSTPDGYSYSLAAVKAGTAERPLASTTVRPADGTTLGYLDYVITNTGTDAALLDFPADLFVKRSRVPASVLAENRCMPQPGAPSDMCTLPDHTDVVNTLGFAPPRSEDGDQYIPAGASYLVRVATDMPVDASVTPQDMGLYVWNPRFTQNRRAVEVPLP